ncbi:unnamed protein product, partial [marine sediment metagenome]
QQQIENTQAGQRIGLAQEKFKYQQEVEAPYTKALTEESKARAAAKRKEPSRSYTADTIKGISASLNITPSKFASLHPNIQDKYYSTYTASKKSAESLGKTIAGETRRGRKAKIKKIANDIENIKTYYGRQENSLDIKINTQKASDFRLTMDSGDFKKKAEDEYEKLRGSTLSSYETGRTEEITRIAKLAVENGYGRIGTDRETGEKVLQLTDGTIIILN